MALKITTARTSDFMPDRELDLYRILSNGPAPSSFTRLLDSFQFNGPNGVHTAFVFEPMGPPLEFVQRLTPTLHRFPKHLGKRILRNVLQDLQSLHTNGIVHADLHIGNILLTIRLDCNSETIEELQQRPEDGKCLKRLDGKQDLWAPPYLLAPAGLLKYSSTELDPYVKIVDIGAGESSHSFDSRLTLTKGLP